LQVPGTPGGVPIRVLVGNRNRADRVSLAKTLKRDCRLRVSGASSAREFLEIAAREEPDLALLSVNLDESSPVGMATLRQFHHAHPKVPTVVFVDCPKRELVLDAFRAGARGIFSRHESLDTLCKCVRVVFEGQIWATSREIRIALDALSSAPPIRALNVGGLSLLSPRELQVVHHLAEGLTNREIGARLGLSRHTIKNYLLKIFDKLGVSNRVELLFLTLSQPAASAQTLREIQGTKKV
jgi:two-component system, NarL family, nitrate/nitrite response regulator NarL